MTCNLIKLLNERLGGFSKSQRMIADYILANYDKAAFMTAGRLAEVVGVSESTVIRFADALGYDGYPDMQEDMMRSAHSNMTVLQRMEVTMRMINKDNAVDFVLKSDMDRIKATCEAIDRQVFNAVADEIASAEKIYIVGLRSSATLADFLGFYFNLMLNDVRIVNSALSSDVSEQVLHIAPRDLIIGISYPRYSRRTVQAMRFASSRGARTVAVTDNKLSPLCPYAKYSLFADTDVKSFVDSLVAPMSLLNALIVSVAIRLGKDITNVLKEVEAIWDENEIFDRLS